MFGTAYEVFGNTEPQMSENDFEKMKLEIEVGCAEAACESMQLDFAQVSLDRAFNMYNHVKNYGIDRTFLSLFNSNGELDNAIGRRFPSCESVDFGGSPYSNMSQAFIAAMEDENEGFFAKIWAFIKRCWNAIANFVSGVWDKFMSLFKKKDEDIDAKLNELDQVKELAGPITVQLPEPINKQAVEEEVKNIKEATDAAEEMAKYGKLQKLANIIAHPVKSFKAFMNRSGNSKDRLKVSLKSVEINNVGDLKKAVRDLRMAGVEFRPSAYALDLQLKRIRSFRNTVGNEMPKGLSEELSELQQSTDNLKELESQENKRVKGLSLIGKFMNWLNEDSKETSDLIMKHRIAIWNAAEELKKKIKADANARHSTAKDDMHKANVAEANAEAGSNEQKKARDAQELARRDLKRANDYRDAANAMDRKGSILS